MKQLCAAIAMMFLSGGIPTLASDDIMSSWKLVRSERMDGAGNVRCTYQMKLANGEVLTRVQMQQYLCTWLPKQE